MFPFKQSCELSFKVDNDDEDNNNPSEQNNFQDQIMLENNALLGLANNFNLHQTNHSISNRGRGRGQGRGRGRGRGRRSMSFGSSSSYNNVDEDEEERKKVFHRETERQRRMEMSTLFDSLRSVIPAHHLKGRRSITDHLEQATNYIKDLEKNVKELGEKRDELKQSVESTSYRLDRGGSSGLSQPYSVVIHQFQGGVQIEICVQYDDEEFLFSTALQVVLEEGLDVVSTTSTKVNERFVHSIQCEVTNVSCIDLNRLEQRLNDLFPRSSDDQ